MTELAIVDYERGAAWQVALFGLKSSRATVRARVGMDLTDSDRRTWIQYGNPRSYS